MEHLELKPGERVLDVGCGIGGGDFYMAAEHGAFVHGVDLSANMVLLALERTSSAGAANVSSHHPAVLLLHAMLACRDLVPVQAVPGPCELKASCSNCACVPWLSQHGSACPGARRLCWRCQQALRAKVEWQALLALSLPAAEWSEFV